MLLFKKKKVDEPSGFSHDDLPPLPPLPEAKLGESLESRPRGGSNPLFPKTKFPEHEPFIPEHAHEKHAVESQDLFKPKIALSKPTESQKPKIAPLPIPQKLEKREESQIPNLSRIHTEMEAKTKLSNERAEEKIGLRHKEEKEASGWRNKKMEEKADEFEMSTRREVHEERPVITETPMNSRARVFVKLDKYNEILRTVNSIENKINDLQNTIRRINDLKSKEKEIIDNWDQLLTATKNTISDVNARLPTAEAR